MAALAAIRHRAILKAFYTRLRDHGKPAKVALIAVRRKLTVLLNRPLKILTLTLFREHRCWRLVRPECVGYFFCDAFHSS